MALLITPYLGSWDFVVLLPLIVFTFMQSNGFRKAALFFLLALSWGAMAYQQVQENFHNYFFWWVPVWTLGIVALITWRNTSASKT